MDKKDYLFGLLAGFFIGVFFLPLLGIAKPILYDRFWVFVIPVFLIGTPLGLLIANLISRKIAVVSQVVKFGVVGVLNTLVDWGVLSFLIFFLRNNFSIDSKGILVSLGLFAVTYYVLLKGISFVVAVINSYYWNKYWTFSGGVVKKTSEEFLQFFVVSVGGFFINVGIAGYVFGALYPNSGFSSDQWGLMGAALGSLAGLAWNFLGYKFVVFKEKAMFF